MANISPRKLVLRCYGHKIKGGKWFGLCLNFNIAIEADTQEQLKLKMNHALVSYIETVLDTNDRASIPELLARRAPLKDWLIYYKTRLTVFIAKFPDNFTFKETLSFPFAHGC